MSTLREKEASRSLNRRRDPMKAYRDFRPTQFDPSGLACDDRQHWLVAPVSRTRDSGALDRSNFRTVLADLGGESDTVEIHRFGHWGPGWFEIILVAPDSAAATSAAEWEGALGNYPVASDEDFSREEDEEAQEVWEHCYSTEQRIAYIAKRRSQFGFRSFADMLGCARGRYFGGYASELLT